MSMDHEANVQQSSSSFAALRRFVRPRAKLEHCEMCNAELRPEHQHLVDVVSRQLVCACQACALLFYGETGSKFRRVPTRVLYLPQFRLTDAQWDGLMIPIQLAFFFNSSPAGKVVAIYPSPAGPTESLLTLESWYDIVRENDILNEMQPDVEALLVNRSRAGSEYYLAPIDACYELVGLIRAHWRGLSGGQEVWQEITEFFARLKKRAGETSA